MHIIEVLGYKLSQEQDGSYTADPILLYRLYKTIDLYYQLSKKGKQTVIICSGKGRYSHNATEAAVMREFLYNNGISDNNIIIEDKSRNTVENIVNCKQIIADLSATVSIDKVYIVSSGFHIPRIKIITLFESKYPYNFQYKFVGSYVPKIQEDSFSITENEILIPNLLQMYRDRGENCFDLDFWLELVTNM